LKPLFTYAVLNVGALAVGSFLMGGNPSDNEWYQQLNKAPWTPPGWVFGVAWMLVMTTFTLFMWRKTIAIENHTTLYVTFGAQWLFNVLWNPVFFRWHQVEAAMILLLMLFTSIIYLMILPKRNLLTNVWALPYLAWLMVAGSLNLYVLWRN
jgi:tryptophan-rich sensory protein